MPPTATQASLRIQPARAALARTWLAALASCLVTGCGGGAGEQPAATQAASVVKTAPQLAVSSEIAPAALFDWAQLAYPQFFYGPTTDGWLAPFSYRHYVWPGNYLGVANGDIYILGPLSNHQLVRVGPVSAVKCHVLPVNSCVDEWKEGILASVNAARQAGGFPTITSHAALGAAAQAHASFSIVHYYPNTIENPALATVQPNGWYTGHVEAAGLVGYTGELPVHRAAAAGYSSVNTIGEVVGPLFGSPTHAEPDMTRCVAAQLDTVFHRAALLEPALEHIGIGISDYASDANHYRLRVCVINTSVRPISISVAREWTGIYPGDGQSGVPSRMGPERPDVAPTIAVKGYPVSLQVRADMHLNVRSFVLVDGQGAFIPSIVVTRAESSWLRPNEAYLVPAVGLAPATRYTAQFTGSAVDQAGTVAINRSWTFSTAP